MKVGDRVRVSNQSSSLVDKEGVVDCKLTGGYGVILDEDVHRKGFNTLYFANDEVVAV